MIKHNIYRVLDNASDVEYSINYSPFQSLLFPEPNLCGIYRGYQHIEVYS